MKKIILLIMVVFQSCGTFEIINTNTPRVNIVKVLTITAEGDTIAVPINKFQNNNYDRFNTRYQYNYPYGNSWEYSYNRFRYFNNYPRYYSNSFTNGNRYYNVSPPVYSTPNRPKVKQRTRPKTRRNTTPPRTSPIPRLRPTNNPPTRRVVPRNRNNRINVKPAKKQ